MRCARGRLRLARLHPGQRRLRAPPGVLLGGIQAGAVDRQGDAIAHQLQQLHVHLGEAARRDTADAEHPHQPARRLARRLPVRIPAHRAIFHQQRHAGDRAQPLPQDGVRPLEVGGGQGVYVRDLGRPTRQDTADEALPGRDPHPANVLFPQPARRAQGQRAAVVVQQRDADGVHAQHGRHAAEQLAQQVVECQVGEGRVGEGLQRAQPGIRRPLPPQQARTLALQSLARRWVVLVRWRQGPPLGRAGAAHGGFATIGGQ